VFYVDNDYWPLNTTLYVYDFRENHPRYIYYLILILPFSAHSDKSAVPGVNRNHLHPLLVLKPPIEDQKAIADFLYQFRFLLQQIGALTKLHEPSGGQIHQSLCQGIHQVIQVGKETVATNMFF